MCQLIKNDGFNVNTKISCFCFCSGLKDSCRRRRCVLFLFLFFFTPLLFGAFLSFPGVCYYLCGIATVAHCSYSQLEINHFTCERKPGRSFFSPSSSFSIALIRCCGESKCQGAPGLCPQTPTTPSLLPLICISAPPPPPPILSSVESGFGAFLLLPFPLSLPTTTPFLSN